MRSESRGGREWGGVENPHLSTKNFPSCPSLQVENVPGVTAFSHLLSPGRESDSKLPQGLANRLPHPQRNGPRNTVAWLLPLH